MKHQLPLLHALLLLCVFDPSPAARAGMRVGDSLVPIDDHQLFTTR